jgi:hypothetical protein
MAMPRTLTALLSLVLAGALVAGCAAPSGSSGSSGSSAPPGPPGPPGPPAPSEVATPSPADPWLLTVDGVGPYRLGQRMDSMPAGIFGDSTPVDAAACPDLVSVAATDEYAGTLLLVARHTVLVDIFSAGGDPTVHTPWGDGPGDSWADVEARHGPGSAAPGAWRTNPSGQRAFVIRDGDRVIVFSVNPIRPGGIGGITAGLADHTLPAFDTGRPC